MLKTPALLLAALFLLPLSHAAEPEIESGKPAVIFVPGYDGTFLRDVNTKERIFITLKSALGRPGTLSLFRKELMTPAGPDLEADGVMDYVPALVTKVDVYGSMMASLAAIEGRQLVTYPYDWRQDPLTWVQGFAALVQKLKAAGVPAIDVVAHSGGGWITTYYMAYGAQPPETAVPTWEGAKNFRRVVLLGVPYRGGWALFRELEKGSTLPLMGHLMPADTMASFPSIYCATPQGDGHILSPKGETIRGASLGAAAFWKENRLGLFQRTDLPAAVMQKREAFLAAKLARCGSFMSSLQFEGAPAAPANVSILAIEGTNQKTLDKSYLVDDRGQPRVLFDVDHPGRQGLDESLMFTDGDGTVPAASGAMPAPLRSRAKIVGVPGVSHPKLTTDGGIKKTVVEFLAR
jgi:pimeloyl-ACP methyl ester carboxylesterase